MTNKYSLPLVWVTTLAELFTSNEYWAKLSQVFGLAVYCDGVYNNCDDLKPKANILEVPISLF